jgi:hypothetical protein
VAPKSIQKHRKSVFRTVDRTVKICSRPLPEGQRSTDRSRDSRKFRREAYRYRTVVDAFARSLQTSSQQGQSVAKRVKGCQSPGTPLAYLGERPNLIYFCLTQRRLTILWAGQSSIPLTSIILLGPGNHFSTTRYYLRVSKIDHMFKIDHIRGSTSIYKIPVPAISLDFACPVCGSQPLEKCILLSGVPRFQSHIERKWIARDHVHERQSSVRPFPAEG